MNGVADYFCDNDQVLTTQTLYTTYRGQSDNDWFTTTVSDDSLTTSRTSFSDDNGSNAPQPTSLDSNPTSGSSEGGDDDDDDDSSTDHSTTKKSKTPVGPIVGGVIGGVAVLLGLGILIFFLLRRKRAAAAAAAAASAPTAAPAPQGPQSPQGPPAYIPDANKPPLVDPNTNSYYGSPASPQNGGFGAAGGYGGGQEMQQQQQQYAQQPQQGGFYDPNTGTYYAPVPQGSPNPTSPTTTAVSGQTNDVIGGGGGAAGVRDSSATGSTGAGAYGYTSPRPGFSEMSGSAGGVTREQREGAVEVEGSRPVVGAPPGGGGITELEGGRVGEGR